jgi:hypothetical protein
MSNQNWLQEILEKRETFESPKKFFYWSALAAISAVVKRNVYIRKRDAETKRTNYILYPNIYVFLVGDSAVVRKGPPIKMARKLVKQVNNTRIISGTASIQGIIASLATAFTTEDGKVITDASCFICASEFKSSLISDPLALSTLTDIFDGDFSNDWGNLLKNSKFAELKDVYPVILGGSNPAYLRDTIKGADIEGGFVGRSFMVYAKDRQRINSLVGDVEGEEEEHDDNKAEEEQYKEEGKWLKQVAELKGKFVYTKEAAKTYDEWYREFTVKDIHDKTGTFGRLHDQVLKVAMLLSLTRRTDLRLTKDEIEEAISACLDLAGDLNRAIMPTGKSAFSEQTNIVLNEMINAPDNEISRQRLLQKHYGDLDAFDLDRIIETLVQTDAIEIRRENSKPHYKLKEWALNEYRKYKGEE